MVDELRLQPAAGAAEYQLAWLALPLGVAGACIVPLWAGLGVTVRPLVLYAAVLCALAGCHYFYRCLRPNERLAMVTGAMTLMIASALCAGIMANAGLRLRFPLADEALSAADRMMGIDTTRLILAVADWPALSWLLGKAYFSIFPITFLTAIWLGCSGRSQRLWELVMGFAAGIQLSALVCIFVPARGSIPHAGLGWLAGSGLPEGSGVFYLHAFRTYRDGSQPFLDTSHLEGVVTFPSFHMVMAIIVAYAFRGTGPFGWLTCVWCGLVAISTVPIGGHYVIDLVGGALLWAALIIAAKRYHLRWSEVRGAWRASPSPKLAP